MHDSSYIMYLHRHFHTCRNYILCPSAETIITTLRPFIHPFSTIFHSNKEKDPLTLIFSLPSKYLSFRITMKWFLLFLLIYKDTKSPLDIRRPRIKNRKECLAPMRLAQILPCWCSERVGRWPFLVFLSSTRHVYKLQPPT